VELCALQSTEIRKTTYLKVPPEGGPLLAIFILTVPAFFYWHKKATRMPKLRAKGLPVGQLSSLHPTGIPQASSTVEKAARCGTHRSHGLSCIAHRHRQCTDATPTAWGHCTGLVATGTTAGRP